MDIDPDSECSLTELPVKMCAHCREKGIYKPKTDGLNAETNLHTFETAKMTIDEDGEIWVSPDEAFLRGDFGNGKHHW